MTAMEPNDPIRTGRHPSLFGYYPSLHVPRFRRRLIVAVSHDDGAAAHLVIEAQGQLVVKRCREVALYYSGS